MYYKKFFCASYGYPGVPGPAASAGIPMRMPKQAMPEPISRRVLTLCEYVRERDDTLLVGGRERNDPKEIPYTRLQIKLELGYRSHLDIHSGIIPQMSTLSVPMRGCDRLAKFSCTLEKTQPKTESESE